MFIMDSPSKRHASEAMGNVLCFRSPEHAALVGGVLFRVHY